jgi:hypothetical protein
MFTHLRPSLEERARSSRIFLGWRDQWWTDPGTTELQVVGAMGMHEDEPKKEDARRGRVPEATTNPTKWRLIA